jgi:hypothetical protein
VPWLVAAGAAIGWLGWHARRTRRKTAAMQEVAADAQEVAADATVTG